MTHLLVALLAGIFPVYPPGGYTGKIPIAGKYTIYFPGGAFDLRGYYGTSVHKLRTKLHNNRTYSRVYAQ